MRQTSTPPEYQKAEYERESGNVWEDTADDFEAQMIVDGMLRVKEEMA